MSLIYELTPSTYTTDPMIQVTGTQVLKDPVDNKDAIYFSGDLSKDTIKFAGTPFLNKPGNNSEGYNGDYAIEIAYLQTEWNTQNGYSRPLFGNYDQWTKCITIWGFLDSGDWQNNPRFDTVYDYAHYANTNAPLSSKEIWHHIILQRKKNEGSTSIYEMFVDGKFANAVTVFTYRVGFDLAYVGGKNQNSGFGGYIRYLRIYSGIVREDRSDFDFSTNLTIPKNLVLNNIYVD